MRTSNNLAKIRRTGLNSFGQPYTGNAIRGVQNKRMMGGRPQGPLSTRPAQATGEVARMQREEAEDMAAMDAAPRAGMAKAQATRAPAAPAAPAKPPGRLIPGSSPGSSVWKTDAELNAMKQKKTPATAGEGGGMLGNAMRSVGAGLAAARRLKAKQDRNYSRARVAQEKTGVVISGKAAAGDREGYRNAGALNKPDSWVEETLAR